MHPKHVFVSNFTPTIENFDLHNKIGNKHISRTSVSHITRTTARIRKLIFDCESPDSDSLNDVYIVDIALFEFSWDFMIFVNILMLSDSNYNHIICTGDQRKSTFDQPESYFDQRETAY